MHNLFRSPLLAVVLLCLVSTEDGEGQEKQDVRLVVQTGHTSEVRSVAFSPDGRRVLTGDQDATRLWDVETGKELLSLAVGAPVMAFAPDGKYIATTAGSGTGDGSDSALGRPYRQAAAQSRGPRGAGLFRRFFQRRQTSPLGRPAFPDHLGCAVRQTSTLPEGRFQKTIPKLTHAVLSPDEKQILAAGPRSAYLLDASRPGRKSTTFRAIPPSSARWHSRRTANAR